MSTFDERENAFENKFAHDAELMFKIEARRNKKCAAWASAFLGIPADEYTLELIKADLEIEGSEDLVQKLVNDLAGKVDEKTIREKIAEFEIEATSELKKEG